jgi:peptidyl-prolyl cis-trans isomerase SurA
MREYREGILLFEITKEKVWDRAPKDTAGVKNFYDQNKENYTWNDRARLLNFKLLNSSPEICDKATRLLMRRGVDQTIQTINKDSVQLTYTTQMVEKGKTDQAISWQESVLFDVQKSSEGCSFKWIEQIIPSKVKTLEEAKGYVISDYQNELEKQWIDDLEKKYDINTNRKALKSLIQSYK